MNNDVFNLGEVDPFDGALLDKLRECSAHYRPAPESIHQGALAAFEWRSVDEELAELLSDSAESERLVGARATLHGIRLMEFVAGAIQISLGLSDSGLLTGTLSGHSEQTAKLVSSAGHQLDLIVDEFGEFICDEIPSGPIRIELGVGPGRIVTDWILPPFS
jgi:hypothetical protein